MSTGSYLSLKTLVFSASDTGITFENYFHFFFCENAEYAEVALGSSDGGNVTFI